MQTIIFFSKIAKKLNLKTRVSISTPVTNQKNGLMIDVANVALRGVPGMSLVAEILEMTKDFVGRLRLLSGLRMTFIKSVLAKGVFLLIVSSKLFCFDITTTLILRHHVTSF